MRFIPIMLTAAALLVAGCSAPEESRNPNEGTADVESPDGGSGSISGEMTVSGNDTASNETASNETVADGMSPGSPP